MRTINRYIGIVLFALSITYIIGAILMPKYSHVPVDSNFLPLILGSLLLVLSVLLFFSKDPEGTSLYVKRKDLMMLIGTIILIILYIMFLERLGFVVATAFFMFTCSFLMGYRSHVVNVLVSVLFPSIIYYVFNHVLMISLPSGILPF